MCFCARSTQTGPAYHYQQFTTQLFRILSCQAGVPKAGGDKVKKVAAHNKLLHLASIANEIAADLTLEEQRYRSLKSDLRPSMMLEGIVTNVTAFGAFVDIGVHQDGLVHVSELADKFVKDPRELVKAGDIVKVRVKDVDVERKRIALTMRSGTIEMPSATRDRGPDVRQSNASTSSTKRPEGKSALAAALRRAREAGRG